MKLFVSEEMMRLFPRLRIGAVTCLGIDNRSQRDRAASLFEEEAAQLRASLSPEELSSIPEIVAWRDAYLRVGQNPRKYPPSAESSIRRVLASKPHRPISPAVDVYLATQLRFRIPVGGYDLTKVCGDITLRRSPGEEPFLSIGASTPETTTAGEVIYADGERVLTRRWNWRDGDAAKIAPESSDIVLMSEAPTESIDTQALEALLECLSRHLQDVCGGAIRKHVWDATNPAPLDLTSTGP